MKFTRNASAAWKGGIKDGKGTMSTDSKVLDGANYGFSTRFEEADGTNPEELLGAALAGCYSMQLSAVLGEDDHTPDELNTKAEVHFEDGIKKVSLKLEGKVPGMDENKFKEAAEKAKRICPVSKLFNAEVSVEAKLLS
jgi:osmotically inducible protein OsmC